MLTEEEVAKVLSIYRNNILILWGCGLWGEHFLTLAEKLDLEIFACCDNDKGKWGTKFHGIPVISPEELKQLNKLKQKNSEEKQIVVQLAISKQQAPILEFQLAELNINNYIQSYNFHLSLISQFFQQYPFPEKEIALLQGRSFTGVSSAPIISLPNPATYAHLVICQPSKTGDSTIAKTYSKHAGIQLSHNHNSNIFDRSQAKERKIRVTTAIRDPISRDLSAMFERLSFGKVLQFSSVSFQDYAHFMETEDSQELFEKVFIQKIHKKDRGSQYIYQNYFSDFRKNILDITAHPFDQEKGYAIMKEGNIEVFMYQLEKLNDLVPELSDWMGLKFDKLENDNVAADKWIASSYERAKREITFSQEYFDTCYNDPYVKHCYSPEDIEKFKEKWRSHIR